MTDITERLRELSKARWDRDAWERETTVRIPAEPDRDIDLVLASAAELIDRLRARVAELEAADGECFTGMIVNIDGHDYGLRPGAARIVKEALADDPELDGTDFANPAWWRGEAYGSSAAIAAVTRILDGKDDGLGVANDEPWQSVRTRLREALRDAGRIGWIARMSKTSTVYMDNQHPWNVSGNYRFNNLRGQTFRDAIDAAMAKDGA